MPKSKAYNNPLPSREDEHRYTKKCRELKVKIKEVEAENAQTQLAILKASRNIERLRIERSVLYEALTNIASKVSQQNGGDINNTVVVTSTDEVAIPIPSTLQNSTITAIDTRPTPLDQSASNSPPHATDATQHPPLQAIPRQSNSPPSPAPNNTLPPLSTVTSLVNESNHHVHQHPSLQQQEREPSNPIESHHPTHSVSSEHAYDEEDEGEEEEEESVNDDRMED